MKYTNIIALILLLSFCSTAQQLDDNRMTDWSIAGRNIPTYSKQKTIDAAKWGCDPTGKKDIGGTLRKLLAKAKPGTIIYFPPGEYLLKSSIDLPPDIVIRGAGSESTKFIARTLDLGFRGIFQIMGSKDSKLIPTLPISAGTHTIDLGSGHNLEPGQHIILTMENDPEVMYTKPKWNQSWAKRCRGQIFTITKTSGTTITLDKSVLLDYPEKFNPSIQKATFKQNVGFENFTIENFQEGDLHTFRFELTINCWLQGVHSINSTKAHVAIQRSRKAEVTECFFQGAFRTDGGGHGYGVLTDKQTSECLVYNNVFTALRHSMITKSGANCNVYAYNFSTGGTWDHLPSIPADISIHGHYAYMNLFEGNIVEHINSADFWGPSGPGITFFRNRVTKDHIDIRDKSIRQNAIGNILSADKEVKFYGPISGALLHGNVISGTPVFDQGMDTQLRPSFYFEKQPDFMTGYPWPLFGPDTAWETSKLPAQERFESGAPVPQPGAN